MQEKMVLSQLYPPHCTHKMQPLDVSYFKPCKSAYNRAADTWMVSNAGKRIWAYETVEIFATAYERTTNIF